MNNNDTIDFDTKVPLKRKKNILLSLDKFDEPPMMISEIVKTAEKKKEEKPKKKKEKTFLVDNSEWDSLLDDFPTPTTKKAPKDLFDSGKKKKKKKKKGDIVDHKKDFESELVLLKSLQIDQDKFVNSLQKKYDIMEGTKSTARGVGKFTTDLIQSITSARSLSRQLVTDIINTKKTMADLDFKERKEFGKESNTESLDAAAYAANFLKEAISKGRTSWDAGDMSIDTGDSMDDFFDDIADSLGDTGRSSETDVYLKYENDNPVIKVLIHSEYDGSSDWDERYDFVAFSDSGKVIPDYPLPKKTALNINNSTGKCRDAYGNIYDFYTD